MGDWVASLVGVMVCVGAGLLVGTLEGDIVGPMVGISEARTVGTWEGSRDGSTVGFTDGCAVGDGETVGRSLGIDISSMLARLVLLLLIWFLRRGPKTVQKMTAPAINTTASKACNTRTRTVFAFSTIALYL